MGARRHTKQTYETGEILVVAGTIWPDLSVITTSSSGHTLAALTWHQWQAA